WPRLETMLHSSRYTPRTMRRHGSTTDTTATHRFSGAGRHVVSSLVSRSPPPQQLADAFDELCTLAASRGVQLLIDAEQVALQGGIDDWGLTYMRKYNT